jgi:uncharacterized membrane protein
MSIHTGAIPHILSVGANAAGAAQGQDIGPVLLTVGALIVVVLALGIVLFVVRDRFLGDGTGEDIDPGGVLESLRAMRDRGEVSEEEYRTAQAALVAKISRPNAENPGADPAGPARARTRAALPGELRAEPGFDLTGAPLPPAVRGGADGSADRSG